MQGQGWVKLWRKSLETQIFKEPDLWQFWCWCLLKASHREEWVPVTVGRAKLTVRMQPGQFAFGKRSAAKALGTTPSSALRRLRTLVRLGQLQVDERERAGPKVTVVSIVNWGAYQGALEKGGPGADPKVTLNPDPKDYAASAGISAASSGEDCQPGPRTEGQPGPQEIRIKKNSSEQPSAAFACPFFSITPEQHEKHLAAYPCLDLAGEYRRMEAWLQANPKKRKTPKGYPGFVNSWLSRAHRDREAQPAAEDWRKKFVEAPD